MSDINEEILRLRKKMIQAVEAGFLDEENKGTYEMSMLQIMNEADRQRRNCLNRSEQLKMQAATAEGQAAAFSMLSSIVNNVVSSMVNKTIKMAEEEKELAEREAEVQKAVEDEDIQETEEPTEETAEEVVKEEVVEEEESQKPKRKRRVTRKKKAE